MPRLAQLPPLLRHRPLPLARTLSSSSPPPSLPSTADAVVVGGGAIGASTAFHLAKRGIKPILMERHKLTSGTTWHSAAMMNSPRLSSGEMNLCLYTKKLARGALEEETGVSAGYVQNGGLTVTRDPDRLRDLKRYKTYGDYFGLGFRLVTPEEVSRLHPLLDTTGILAGLYSETDGYADPLGLTNSYAKGARDLGASVLEECPVEELLVREGKIVGVRTAKGVVHTSTVILCAGAWSRALGAGVGVEVPLIASKHWYLVTEIMPQIKDAGRKLPNLRVMDDSIYFKTQNETIQAGSFEFNPTFVDPVDPGLTFGLYNLEDEVFEPMMEKMLNNIPSLKDVGTRSLICGPESFTPDGKPLLGETPEVRGLFLNCAMNSKGVHLSGGMGREAATLVDTGAAALDVAGYDPARFEPEIMRDDQWRKQGAQEAELRFYWPAFPHSHKFAGRNRLLSPLHKLHLQKGAFFGCYGGYEIPNFYIEELGEKLAIPEYDWYGAYGHQRGVHSTAYGTVWRESASWRPSARVAAAVAAEAAAARDAVAIFDLSAMGRLVVSGPGALSRLQWLCSADVDIPVDSWVYTLMLNQNGGIESELVVVRDSPDSFCLLPGSGARGIVARRVRHARRGGAGGGDAEEEVSVTDETAETGAISVQGPRSAALLSRLMGTDLVEGLLSPDGRGGSSTGSYSGVEVRAHALSYVGERGVELHAPRGKAAELAEGLLRAGKEVGVEVKMAGMEAMMDLHMEAGFRHWHGDVDGTDTPYETGLMGACKMDKDIDFIGRGALAARRKAGTPKQRMVTFTVGIEHELVGSETIFRNGKLTGYVVRTGRTHRHDRYMGNGYVDGSDNNSGEGATEEFVKKAKYEIECAGRRVPAEVHLEPVYSPKS